MTRGFAEKVSTVVHIFISKILEQGNLDYFKSSDFSEVSYISEQFCVNTE